MLHHPMLHHPKTSFDLFALLDLLDPRRQPLARSLDAISLLEEMIGAHLDTGHGLDDLTAPLLNALVPALLACRE